MQSIKGLVAKVKALQQVPTSQNGQPSTPIQVKTYHPTPADSCPDCAGTGFFRQDVPTDHKNFGVLVPCDNPVHSPDRLAKLAEVSGLHPSELNRRLRDIARCDGNVATLQAARELTADPYGWLYIWGGPGNAKSEILKAIVNELNEAEKGPAMYTNFSTILDYMRDSFRDEKYQDKHGLVGTGAGYVERFEELKRIKVLAIDEMDKARSTEFADEFRFSFLDARYEQAIRGETVTVFASNTHPERFSDTIWDRIRDGRFRVVENKAGSARPEMRR